MQPSSAAMTRDRQMIAGRVTMMVMTLMPSYSCLDSREIGTKNKSCSQCRLNTSDTDIRGERAAFKS